MTETSEERRARVLARCIDLLERDGPGAADRACAEHPDLAEEIRKAAAAMSALFGAASATGLGLPAAGRMVGRFRIEGELGRGGMGVVFRAFDPALDRIVALKVLPSPLSLSADALERFRREGRALAQLRHPNAVAVHEVGETEEGVPYIAMEFVDGEPLDRIVERAFSAGLQEPTGAVLRPGGAPQEAGSGSRRASWVEAIVQLGSKVADALEQAHRAGVVHRDVKPGNILVDREGEPRLVDFGLARGGDAVTVTRTGSAAGTPAYMSPEQVAGRRGEVGPATDVYGLGATLYHALTSRPPFEGETSEQVFEQVRRREPMALRRRNASVPRDLETVVLKAMEKDAARRYASAGQFRDDLEALLALRPIRARPAGPLTRAGKFVRRNPSPTAAAAVLLLAAVGIGGLLFKQHLDARSAEEARRNLFAGHLQAAREALANGDFPRARDVVGLARGIEPDSGEARDLLGEIERSGASADAERAIGEAREQLLALQRARATIEALRTRLNEAKKRIEAVPTTADEQTSRWSDEEALDRERQELDARFNAAHEALTRAMRREPGNASIPTVLADLWLEKWREALAVGDEATREVCEARVREYDQGGLHAVELEGRGMVALSGTPEGAETYLFRYELQSKVRPGGEKRLVPVPFDPGRGMALPRSAPGFHPGVVALAVHGVEPGSPADRAGLRRGDLILRVAELPIEGTLFVLDVVPDGLSARAGVRRLDRLVRVAGHAALDEYAVEMAGWERRRGENYEAEFVRPAAEIRVGAVRKGDVPDDLGVRVGSAADLLAGPLPEGKLELRVLSNGEERTAELDGGAPPGMRATATACPFALSPENLLGRLPIAPFQVPPGSYVLVLRAKGREDLRLPILVPRGGRAEARADLLSEGTTPEEFVHVPPGTFIAGGDPEAAAPRRAETRFVEAYWIARAEVTARQYDEFLNDPAVMAEIEAAAGRGETIRVPRINDFPNGRVVPFWFRGESGPYEPVGQPTLQWQRIDAALNRGERVPFGVLGRDWRRIARVHFRLLEDGGFLPVIDPRWPIQAVTFEDVAAFARWKTERARRAGEAWTFRLPTEDEWEKAARGSDGRKFPWGESFSPLFSKGACARPAFRGSPEEVQPEPVDRFLRDESPFGILGMAGGVIEWCEGPARNHLLRSWRGGALQVREAAPFRSASRMDGMADRATQNDGFRLVAVRSRD
ncbi:MAG TPA: SUMF1/EgtB/PvdO family nonheme iron enzyme [Planctomycetota bacterium]|nr:SUMF1/EgtB/PvdO family nonheme iron enzyme [Planctomycetota bacterium]